MQSIKLTFRNAHVPIVRNFAEELSLSLRDAPNVRKEIRERGRRLRGTHEDLGFLPMSDADAATDVLLVTKVRKSRIRQCRIFIEKLLASHFLFDKCAIEEQPDSDGMQNGGTVADHIVSS